MLKPSLIPVTILVLWEDWCMCLLWLQWMLAGYTLWVFFPHCLAVVNHCAIFIVLYICVCVGLLNFRFGDKSKTLRAWTQRGKYLSGLDHYVTIHVSRFNTYVDMLMCVPMRQWLYFVVLICSLWPLGTYHSVSHLTGVERRKTTVAFGSELSLRIYFGNEFPEVVLRGKFCVENKTFGISSVCWSCFLLLRPLSGWIGLPHYSYLFQNWFSIATNLCVFLSDFCHPKKVVFLRHFSSLKQLLTNHYIDYQDLVLQVLSYIFKVQCLCFLYLPRGWAI